MRRAFTLLEVVVSATLLSMVMLLAVRFLVPTMRASAKGVLRVEMQQTAVVALNKLVSDLERTSPAGISLRTSAAPVALGVCPLSDPTLRTGQPGPLQADGTPVWSSFFLIYYFDPTAGQLRRREWPPGNPTATTEEVSLTKARRLSPDRLGLILAEPGSNESILAAEVESFEILQPPGGNEDVVKQPLRFRLTLARRANTGNSRPERFVYARSAFVRNLR